MSKEMKKSKKVKKRSLYLIGLILLLAVGISYAYGQSRPEAREISLELEPNFIDEKILSNPIRKKGEEEYLKREENRLELELDTKRKEVIKKEEARIEEEKKQAAAKKDNIEQGTVVADGSKVAYLTFDDGPSKNVTPEVLDILKRNNIKATFFILGRSSEMYPDLVRRIYNEGHSIGHHSYSHDYNFLYSSYDNYMSEIYRNNQIFKGILGEGFSTNIMRLPGGAFGAKKLAYVERAREDGYVNYNWNATNGDAEGHHLPENFLLGRVKTTKGNRQNLVLLMHDATTKNTTASSLQMIIDYLIQEGYSFDKLDQTASRVVNI